MRSLITAIVPLRVGSGRMVHPRSKEEHMPFDLKTGAKAIGLAALIAGAAPLAIAEDGPAIKWSKKSSWFDKDAGWKINLGSKLEAYWMTFDVDDEYLQDHVIRETAGFVGAFPTASDFVTAAIDVPVWDEDSGEWDRDFTPAFYDEDAFVAAVGEAYFGVGAEYTEAKESWADGMVVDDLELFLNGEAYDNIVFGISFEGAGGSLDVEAWYMGIQNIPFVGTFYWGELDGPGGVIGDGSFHDDDFMDWLTDLPDQVGFWAENEWELNGGVQSVGYLLAIGLDGSDPVGAWNRNYQIEAILWGVPWSNEQVSIMAMLSAQFLNPTPSGNDPYTAEWAPSAKPELKPGSSSLRPLRINAHADDVMIVSLSADVTFGPGDIGLFYAMGNTSVYDAGDNTQAFVDFIVDGEGDFNIYEDGEFTTWGAYASFSITGEKQKHGGGISKPKANFAFDGSGFGALEVALRYIYADMQDNVRDTYTFYEDDVLATFSSLGANREEGGTGSEIALALNWYLTPNFSLGLIGTWMNWQYDDDVISRQTDLRKVAKSWELSSIADGDLTNDQLVQLYAWSSIENEYSAFAYYLRGTVKF